MAHFCLVPTDRDLIAPDLGLTESDFTLTGLEDDFVLHAKALQAAPVKHKSAASEAMNQDSLNKYAI